LIELVHSHYTDVQSVSGPCHLSVARTAHPPASNQIILFISYSSIKWCIKTQIKKIQFKTQIIYL